MLDMPCELQEHLMELSREVGVPSFVRVPQL